MYFKSGMFYYEFIITITIDLNDFFKNFNLIFNFKSPKDPAPNVEKMAL